MGRARLCGAPKSCCPQHPAPPLPYLHDPHILDGPAGQNPPHLGVQDTEARRKVKTPRVSLVQAQGEPRSKQEDTVTYFEPPAQVPGPAGLPMSCRNLAFSTVWQDGITNPPAEVFSEAHSFTSRTPVGRGVLRGGAVICPGSPRSLVPALSLGLAPTGAVKGGQDGSDRTSQAR